MKILRIIDVITPDIIAVLLSSFINVFLKSDKKDLPFFTSVSFVKFSGNVMITRIFHFLVMSITYFSLSTSTIFIVFLLILFRNS
ncbi:MAG: hypothetical protein N2712_03425 [Brevinematales bacterium]|nr:hypothetical protein [Brevinematales bacterium]